MGDVSRFVTVYLELRFCKDYRMKQKLYYTARVRDAGLVKELSKYWETGNAVAYNTYTSENWRFLSDVGIIWRLRGIINPPRASILPSTERKW